MSTQAQPIAQALVQWFEKEGRDYPWRRTHEAWAILVSELMLQQTTISTVLGRYQKWMEQFPTPASLAEATEEEALRSWEGLGYYRRVRALQQAARAISTEHGGVFPQEESAIRALPGIGDYTVGAVLSFAYNRPAPLVDANVSRVFSRLFNDATPIDSTAGRKLHWEWARQLVHPTNARAYNSALMELGQRMCSIKAPTCLICPLREFCQCVQAKRTPEELPVKLSKPKITAVEHHDILCLHPELGLLMQRQEAGQRHEGMYRLPRRETSEVTALPLLTSQKYTVTRYKVTRHLYQAPSDTAPQAGEEFILLDLLAALPMASPCRKLVTRWVQSGK